MLCLTCNTIYCIIQKKQVGIRKVDFIRKENLYNNHDFIVEGIKHFKYVDLLIYREGKFYHIVLVKKGDLFTLLMSDFKTLPDYNLAEKALNMLLKTDLSSFSVVEKPEIDQFKKLLNVLTPDKFDYKNKNYVLNINTTQVPPTSYNFRLNSNIEIKEAYISITNLETNIEICINNSDLCQISGYHQFFSLTVDDEISFKNLLCLNIESSTNYTTLNLANEEGYFLKSRSVDKMHIKGNPLWALELMRYATNINRDVPIEINLDNLPSVNFPRRYFFVFPLKGIKLKTDIRFGMVSFSPDSGIEIKFEQLLRDVTNNDFDCFAQIVIAQNSPKDAIEDAIKLLKKTINILKLLLLDDSPFLLFNHTGISNNWDIKNIERTIIICSHFYIEDVWQNETVAILPYNQKRTINKLIPNEPLLEEINNETILENYFYSEETEEKESILQSIFWLNNSFENVDKKERIISLYNSIEFLVKKEQGISLDEELSKKYEDYNKIKNSIFDIVNSINNSELKNRISGALNKCFNGDTSVKTKFTNLVNRLNISLSKREREIFDVLKNSRHALIHNKKISREINSEELDELYHLISKLIISKIILNSGK